MKTKILIYSMCIFLFTIIQSTVLDYIRIFNVKPNLLIVFVVSAALLKGNKEGAVVGFFAGLSQDIASGKVIGFYTLLGMYLGLFIGLLNKRIYRENFLVIVFFTFISTFFYEGAVYLLGTFLKDQLNLLFPVRYIILPEAIYNCFISIFMFILVMRVNDRIESSIKTRKY